MKYKMIPNNDNKNCTKTLVYFINLYAMWKTYLEYRATESRFDSAANITYISPPASIQNASTK